MVSPTQRLRRASAASARSRTSTRPDSGSRSSASTSVVPRQHVGDLGHDVEAVAALGEAERHLSGALRRGAGDRPQHAFGAVEPGATLGTRDAIRERAGLGRPPGLAARRERAAGALGQDRTDLPERPRRARHDHLHGGARRLHLDRHVLQIGSGRAAARDYRRAGHAPRAPRIGLGPLARVPVRIEVVGIGVSSKRGPRSSPSPTSTLKSAERPPRTTTAVQPSPPAAVGSTGNALDRPCSRKSAGSRSTRVSST